MTVQKTNQAPHIEVSYIHQKHTTLIARERSFKRSSRTATQSIYLQLAVVITDIQATDNVCAAAHL
jgi:hypothetical protein